MKKRLSTLLFALVVLMTTAHAQENTIDGHEYVDLGLPSGTLWASCNIGATKPENYGDYFAWGETKPKEIYYFNNYFDNEKIKYNAGSLTELLLEDDAAYANWGSNWRIPSWDQIKELIDNCNWEWTTLNGVYGKKVTSKTNGKSIFLPAAGLRNGNTLTKTDSEGFYWSRTLDQDPSASRSAEGLYFRSGFIRRNGDYMRINGQSVRPVHLPK